VENAYSGEAIRMPFGVLFQQIEKQRQLRRR
jgi:hypothetical protein